MLLSQTVGAQTGGVQPPPNRYGSPGISAQQAPDEVVTGDQVETVEDARESIGSRYLNDTRAELEKQERDQYLEGRPGARDSVQPDSHTDAIAPKPLPGRAAPLDGPKSNPTGQIKPRDPAKSPAPIQPKSGLGNPPITNPAARGTPSGIAAPGITSQDAGDANPAATTRATPLQSETLPPKTAAAAPRADMTAIDALATVFAEQPASPIAGEPLTLSAALSRRSDREGRLRVAHAYWKLSAATAAYSMAVAEAGHTARLVQSSSVAHNPIERQLIDVAHAGARARTNETLTAVVSAQYDLAEALGGATDDKLPLAADAPYLGTYATRFNELFADRAAPMQIRAIHKTLPTLHLAVGQRAQASLAAVVVVERAEQAWLGGTLDIGALLAALQHASLQRQAFLSVARAYNDDIADYAINVAREGTGATELTTMLIRTPGSQDARRNQQPPARSATNTLRGVRQTEFTQPIEDSTGVSATSQGSNTWRAAADTGAKH
jgi:hypothetical protein